MEGGARWQLSVSFHAKIHYFVKNFDQQARHNLEEDRGRAIGLEFNNVFCSLSKQFPIFLRCSETLLEHGPGGELVGTDHNGNRYYEKKDAQVGRNRWVVYGKGDDWRNQNPSSVPPEWHNWLHFISDENDVNVSLNLLFYLKPSITLLSFE